MSDTSYSDHPALEFLDEEPTQPGIAAVQRQLDSATSVVDGFVARARHLGFDRQPDVPRWMAELSTALDAAPTVDGEEMDA